MPVKTIGWGGMTIFKNNENPPYQVERGNFYVWDGHGLTMFDPQVHGERVSLEHEEQWESEGQHEEQGESEGQYHEHGAVEEYNFGEAPDEVDWETMHMVGYSWIAVRGMDTFDNDH